MLAAQGVKRVGVACPSFVADYLETVEEIALRGRDVFVRAGGEELRLIPSLNSNPAWVDAVARWVKEAEGHDRIRARRHKTELTMRKVDY